eukprot:TRINITY_DN18598_c0_g3_i2.p3 TRINITY_DN18598_c0_g3~~TRINITY_DN18598_c0_g3_i2.p3  ORF type:complete len:113 (-),score=14.47 TRINITY_DN18598_c0_g3_i2:307-645(-)
MDVVCATIFEKFGWEFGKVAGQCGQIQGQFQSRFVVGDSLCVGYINGTKEEELMMAVDRSKTEVFCRVIERVQFTIGVMQGSIFSVFGVCCKKLTSETMVFMVNVGFLFIVF